MDTNIFNTNNATIQETTIENDIGSTEYIADYNTITGGKYIPINDTGKYYHPPSLGMDTISKRSALPPSGNNHKPYCKDLDNKIIPRPSICDDECTVNDTTDVRYTKADVDNTIKTAWITTNTLTTPSIRMKNSVFTPSATTNTITSHPSYITMCDATFDSVNNNNTAITGNAGEQQLQRDAICGTSQLSTYSTINGTHGASTPPSKLNTNALKIINDAGDITKIESIKDTHMLEENIFRTTTTSTYTTIPPIGINNDDISDSDIPNPPLTMHNDKDTNVQCNNRSRPLTTFVKMIDTIKSHNKSVYDTLTTTELTIAPLSKHEKHTHVLPTNDNVPITNSLSIITSNPSNLYDDNLHTNLKANKKVITTQSNHDTTINYQSKQTSTLRQQ